MAEDSVAQDQLRSFIERIERLDEELKAINDDKREIYAEAKGNGFDVAAMKTVLKMRRMDHNERMEREAIVELYMSALGMIAAPTEAEEDRALTRARAPARTRGAAEPVQKMHEFAEPQSRVDDGQPIHETAAPKPAPDSEDMTASRIERLPEAKTMDQEPSEAEGSGGVQDECAIHPAAIQPETANDVLFRGGDSPQKNNSGSSEHDSWNSPTAGDWMSGAEPLMHEAGSGVLEESVPLEHSHSAPMREGSEPTEAHNLGTAGSTPAPATSSNSVSTEPPSPLTEGEGDHPTGALPVSSPATGKPGPVAAGPALAPGEVRYEKCPPHGMVRHDFQRCFPERWGPAVADLTDDIRKNGVKRPIIMLDGFLLDGWARYLAAREIGIEYPITEYDGADPLLDVIRWNIESRKLTMNERKTIAAKLIKLPAIAHRAHEIALLFGLEVEEGQVG